MRRKDRSPAAARTQKAPAPHEVDTLSDAESLWSLGTAVELLSNGCHMQYRKHKAQLSVARLFFALSAVEKAGCGHRACKYQI